MFCFYLSPFLSFFLCRIFYCLLQIIEELQNVRESESRYKQQNIEALKREKMLIRRLAAKEQEMQEYVVRYKIKNSFFSPLDITFFFH